MQEIRGDAKNIRSLLSGAKFSIDYYQREYRWERKHIAELLIDLTEKFYESHKEENDRSAVEYYGHYFLGSIIISDKDGKKFIIDGQQRLTSLTLLLIYIHHHLRDEDQKGQLTELIFSKKYGKRSFNLDVPERTECMEALFVGNDFDENEQLESTINIIQRYNDIADLLSDELYGDTLPYFADWLIENVHFVEITAYSDADAYLIFETMNDRGLSLSSTDMLKGYLLANIHDQEKRKEASSVWRKRIESLNQMGKEEDSDAIKSWLRSQHAQSIRERKQGAKPRDFDRIGTEFHRWIRDKQNELNLSSGNDFANFIKEDFAFYTRWYERIRNAAENLIEGLEAIFYNAQNNFTLQYPVLLSPIVPTDNEEEIYRKLRITATYIDILIARRIWNWKTTSYSSMQYNMFMLIILNIRNKPATELAEILHNRLHEEHITFDSNEGFALHGMNGPQVHRILARITDFVETSSGQPSRFREYVQRGGRDGYEIEHIWANHFERHQDEFGHPTDFAEYRNRIGGLILLPKSFNASYSDLPYTEKRDHYFGQNLLAQSLHEHAYQHNPGFRRFVETSGLPFQAHDEFKKADLDERQELYRKIAEEIWNPDNLFRERER